VSDLAFLHDLTHEQVHAIARVESLLAQHFARLEARRRAPFSLATAAATPGGSVPSLPMAVAGDSFADGVAA
jgi:hypothetical protein